MSQSYAATGGSTSTIILGQRTWRWSSKSLIRRCAGTARSKNGSTRGPACRVTGSSTSPRNRSKFIPLQPLHLALARSRITGSDKIIFPPTTCRWFSMVKRSAFSRCATSCHNCLQPIQPTTHNTHFRFGSSYGASGLRCEPDREISAVERVDRP